MKIDDLITVLNKKKEKHGNVEVRAVAPMSAGFLLIDEILHRSDYYDDNIFFSGEQEKGNFISIELVDKND